MARNLAKPLLDIAAASLLAITGTQAAAELPRGVMPADDAYSDASDRANAQLSDSDLDALTRQLRARLQMPGIFITSLAANRDQRWQEIQGWSGISEQRYLKNQKQDPKLHYNAADITRCLATTSRLGGKRADYCMVNGPLAGQTPRALTGALIFGASTDADRSILDDLFLPQALDACGSIILQTLHEYFHGVDLTTLRPRVPEQATFWKPGQKNDRLAKAAQPGMLNETLADLAAVELYYRISSPEQRPLIIEQAKDLAAIRHLGYGGLEKVAEADKIQRRLDPYYTAPSLEAWIEDAEARDHKKIPVWSQMPLTPQQIVEVGAYALDLAKSTLQSVTVAEVKQQGLLNAALTAVVADRTSAQVPDAKDLNRTAAQKRNLLVLDHVVADPRTTPAMLAATREAMQRLTQLQLNLALASKDDTLDPRAILPFDHLQKPMAGKAIAKPRVTVRFNP